MEMPKDVYEALGEILQEFGDNDLEPRLECFRDEEEAEEDVAEEDKLHSGSADALETNWCTVADWFDANQDTAGTDFALNMTERAVKKRDEESAKSRAEMERLERLELGSTD
jgi:hypothetical protein